MLLFPLILVLHLVPSIDHGILIIFFLSSMQSAFLWLLSYLSDRTFSPFFAGQQPAVLFHIKISQVSVRYMLGALDYFVKSYMV
jgi:hypothetical protein